MQPRHTRRRSLERNGQRGTMSWAEICCFGCSCLQLVWPRLVLRKWLNLGSRASDYGADSDGDDGDDTFFDAEDSLPRLRRRNSETFRAQYINTKDIRICVGTWNVGGKIPPDDLDIEEWLNVNEPADIYVLGLQEVVPLNAGNIFGAEDNRPILKWETIIRETPSRVHRAKTFKSYSDPPSPSKFKPTDDVPDFEDEVLLGFDSDGEGEFHHVDEEPGFYEVRDETVCGPGISKDGGVSNDGEKDLKKQFSEKLNETLSGTARIGLSWPEPPLNLMGQLVLERPCSFKSTKRFKMSRLFKTFSSNKMPGDIRTLLDATALAEIDLESLIQRRRRPEYVRIVSKQMIGIFLTIWVRRHLRKNIQNLKVSTVGVGVMGYIGNKGSVSVSMSIYQTLFCFICTHLTSGEKEADHLKRNTDVHEIHRRTLFHPDSGLGVPKSIYDHERIIWLGDLNYRINLPYEETRNLILKKEWSKLVDKDQLVRELKKGHVFDGWCEGVLDFPPTYKYEMNSDNYCGEDPKAGRRNPAWCDRILSFGNGIKLMKYRRSEVKLSDHRPVTAIYDVEVEVFSPKKLQRALTFTDAEIENEEILIDKGMSHLQLEEMLDWGRRLNC